MAAKKTSTKNSKSAQSKAAFVRANPSLSPKQIVVKGKAEGIKLAASYVYNVRGYDKAKTKKKTTKLAVRRSAERTGPPVVRPITASTKAEDLLRAVAAEVGLGRAIELLEAERARVHAVLRG
jgi:hypothetical protein